MKLLLVLVSNVLIVWTLINIFTAEADTMFVGVLVWLLIIVEVYYLIFVDMGNTIIKI